MPIDETITGTGASGTSVSLSATSEVLFSGDIDQRIIFQCKSTNGDWIDLLRNTQTRFIVATPDPTTLYRFLADGATKSVKVFFGP